MKIGSSVVAVLLLFLAGCGSSNRAVEPDIAVPDGDWSMAKADPSFSAHFTDPIYEDVIDERTPFGSYLGADLLVDWEDRREELGSTSTVAEVLGADPQEVLKRKSFDDAQFVQAAGFVLLRLAGHIDSEGKKATLMALDQLLGPEMFGDDPVLKKQREDLRSWPAD